MLMLLGLVYQVYLTLFGNLPVWMHVASTLFWRCGYDVFLGFLLRQQSNTKYVISQCLRHQSVFGSHGVWVSSQLLPSAHPLPPTRLPAFVPTWHLLFANHIPNPLHLSLLFLLSL